MRHNACVSVRLQIRSLVLCLHPWSRVSVRRLTVRRSSLSSQLRLFLIGSSPTKVQTHALQAKCCWTQAVASLQDGAAHTWAAVDLSVSQHSVPAAAAAVCCHEAACQHGHSHCDWNEYDCIIWNLLLHPPPPQTWYKSNRIKIYLSPLRHLPKNNLLCCVTDTANPLLFTWHARLYLSLCVLAQASTTAWLTTCDREALDFPSVLSLPAKYILDVVATKIHEESPSAFFGLLARSDSSRRHLENLFRLSWINWAPQTQLVPWQAGMGHTHTHTHISATHGGSTLFHSSWKSMEESTRCRTTRLHVTYLMHKLSCSYCAYF